MFQIFAHRGLLPYPENSLEALQKALEAGFGIEFDVRWTKDGKAIISHDAALRGNRGIRGKTLGQLEQVTEVNLFTEVLELFERSSKAGAMAAVHLKDSTYNYELPIDGINDYGSVFVFDTTLPVAEKLKQLQPGLQIALSVGEPDLFSRQKYRNMHPTIYTSAEVKSFPYFDYVWADEWKGGLYSEEFIKQFHELGKRVYAISPELHKNTEPSHPMAGSLDRIKILWADLIKWEVDGICTDFPKQCRGVYERVTGKKQLT